MKKQLNENNLYKVYFTLVDNLNLFIHEHFDFIKVKQPIFYGLNEESDVNNIGLENSDSRTINFDALNSAKILTLYNNFDNWAINYLIKNNFKSNNGIFFEANYINRDSEISDVEEIEKNYLLIYFLYDGKNLTEKIEQLFLDFYQQIFKINSKLNKIYPTIKQQIKPNYKFIDFKSEKRKYLIKNTELEILRDILIKYQVVLFKNNNDNYSLRYIMSTSETNKITNIEICNLKIINYKNNTFIKFSLNLKTITMLLAKINKITDVF